MLRQIVLEALRNARVHWLRALLTASGIVWGIALFLLMTGFGSAAVDALLFALIAQRMNNRLAAQAVLA